MIFLNSSTGGLSRSLPTGLGLINYFLLLIVVVGACLIVFICCFDLGRMPRATYLLVVLG